jgi:large subunit ribosomal protein L10
MDNPRPEKVAVVDEVRERLEGTEAVLVTEYRGLDVPALADLRKSLREAGGEYKIYKNTLVRLAARDLDLEIEELLNGPTALAFTTTKPDGSAGDPVNVAKALRDFGKEHEELIIKGGLLGDERLDVDQIMQLASIAPRDELLAHFAGLLAAPMQRFAGLLAAVPRDFAYALQALIEKAGGPDAAEEPAEAEEPIAVEEPAAAEEPAEPESNDSDSEDQSGDDDSDSDEESEEALDTSDEKE